MADYVVSSGRSSTYPALHYGGHFVGTRATFCEPGDLKAPSANVLAMPNAPVALLTASPIAVTDKFLGLHYSLRTNDNSAAVTTKTVRSHDIDGGKGRWSKIQPTDTTVLASWDFTAMDLWYAQHRAEGRDMIFTLFATPTWASARPTEEGIYGSSNLGIQAEPTDMTDWSFYCTTMATRYPYINYWEVWNEPNMNNDGTGPTALGISSKAFFFSGTWAKLSQMTRLANVAIKAVIPGAKILCPPVQGWASTGTDVSGAYFAGMMAASSGDGGSTPLKNWIDIVGVHLYSNTNSEPLSVSIDRALAARSAAGLTAKEIWDTESSPGPTTYLMTDAQLTRYLSRTFVLFAAKGFSRHIFYMFDSTTYGFMSRAVVETHWNTMRTLLMSGTILGASRLWDGRIAYWTSATDPVVV